MDTRRSGRRHTAPARAAAAAAVGAALIVPLTGAAPGTSEPAATATGAPTVSDGVSPSGVSTPTEDPSPDEKTKEADPDEDSIEGYTKYRNDGTVQFFKKQDGHLKAKDLDGSFDCNIEGFAPKCSIDNGGFLIVAQTHFAEPASAPDLPRSGEHIQFREDPKITFEVGSDKKLKVTSDRIPLEALGDPDSPSPSPTDDPTQGPSDEPTDEPTAEPSPEPTNGPPDDDSPSDDDPRRDSEPREDDSPESTAPPSSPEDPNSGNGRRSVRVPGQAGDDWAPTGDGSGQNPHYNYADPVPRAPGGDESAADDAISAKGSRGGETGGPAETSADSADDDATDMASATGSAWAVGGLVGIAAVAIGLVVFILGRSRRRRAH